MTLRDLSYIQLLMISKNIENRLQTITKLMLFFNYTSVDDNKYEFKLTVLIADDIREIYIFLSEGEYMELQSYEPEIFIEELQSIITKKFLFKLTPFAI